MALLEGIIFVVVDFVVVLVDIVVDGVNVVDVALLVLTENIIFSCCQKF